MKAKLYCVLAFLVGLTAASVFSAQQNKPPKAGTARFGDPTSTAQHLQDYIYGVVKKVEKDKLVLDKTEFGDDQPFRLEPKTKYVYDGNPGKLQDLKTGDKVFVQIKRDKKTGDMIARRVVTGVPSGGAP